MTPDEYLRLSAKTDDISMENQAKRKDRVTFSAINMLHAAIGVATEAGELLDAVKKEIFYGKEADPVNIKEEVGDCLWYLALMCRTYNMTLEECMEANIAKLRKRYGDKFTEHAANNRDLPAEYMELAERKAKTFKVRRSIGPLTFWLVTCNTDITYVQPKLDAEWTLDESKATNWHMQQLEIMRNTLRTEVAIDYLFSN